MDSSLLHISANSNENHSLLIVSIDCDKKRYEENIAVHKVPAIHRGENPAILKEFQGM